MNVGNEQLPTSSENNKSELIRATLRKRVISQMRDGSGMHVLRQAAFGDHLIYTSAIKTVLDSLAKSKNIQYPPLTFTSYPEGKNPINHKSFDLTLALDESAFQLRINPPIASSFYEKEIKEASRTLGVTVSPEALSRVPQPYRMDFGPLEHFDREHVEREGAKLREEILQKHGLSIMIAQSGSQIEKRLSDEQVVKLVKFIRKIQPNAHITVATDKLLLRDKDSKVKNKAQRKKSGTSSFYFGSEEFLTEINTNPYRDIADSIVNTRDINELCKYFYATDTLIATDGFWAWLGAGTKSLRPDRNGKIHSTDVFNLYTVADNNFWNIPGTTSVISPRIETYRKKKNIQPDQFLTPSQYKEAHDESDNGNRKINESDIQQLEEVIASKIGLHSS